MVLCDYLQKLFYSDPYPQICTSEKECKKAQQKLETYCSTCTIFIPMAKFLILTDQKPVLEKIAISICVGPDLSNKIMCQNIINTYKHAVYKVLEKTPLSDDELCFSFLECKPVSNKAVNWTINLPNKKPDIQPPGVIKVFFTFIINHFF